MKLGKGGVAALGATAAVMVFSAGHFMGGGSVSGDYQVSTQRPAETQPVIVTAQPSEEPLMVDINTADSAALQALPGIGPQRAEDIIAYREEHGPFRYAEEITKVPGIGEGILAGLADYITAGEVAE